MRLHWKPTLGSNTKLATSGPTAAPAVLNKVVIPVLFIRSSTLAWTRATMVGNKTPDKNETGNVKARHSNTICGQEARLKAPPAVFTASPGKKRYDKSTAIAVSSRRIGSN